MGPSQSSGASSNPKQGSNTASGCGTILLALLILLIGGILIGKNLFIRAPKEGVTGHKSGCSTILLAGTDHSGINTDTIMLINFNSTERRISLMSIPRDTRVDCNYKPRKINGAYAANGYGEVGMEWLCEYVRQSVGFKPDGYVLVDLDFFVKIVDHFGGVTFDVPRDMYYDDPSQDLYIHLDPGLQHLDGYEAMGLVRYRQKYAMQDLDRVQVQRNFFHTAVSQWREKSDIFSYYKAYQIFKEECTTNLSASNLLWFLKAVSAWDLENSKELTMPYTIGADYYIYIKANDEYLELINEYFNPYEHPVDYEDLNIVEE